MSSSVGVVEDLISFRPHAVLSSRASETAVARAACSCCCCMVEPNNGRVVAKRIALSELEADFGGQVRRLKSLKLT